MDKLYSYADGIRITSREELHKSLERHNLHYTMHISYADRFRISQGYMDQTGSSILDRFSVVLLDMNSTFMFDEDRFGPEQDYAATYRSFGGTLSAEWICHLIGDCYDRLDALYLDPARHDSFPTVKETLRSLSDADQLSETELDRLEQTFAAHELGRVPEEYAAALRRLATSHRLALVADVWAQKEPWLKELRRVGVLNLFEATVFSSEIGSVKPSPRSFLAAVEKLNAEPEDCVVVGDSARRDIGGAKAAGLPAVWIGQSEPPEAADYAVRDLLDLIQ